MALGAAQPRRPPPALVHRLQTHPGHLRDPRCSPWPSPPRRLQIPPRSLQCQPLRRLVPPSGVRRAAGTYPPPPAHRQTSRDPRLRAPLRFAPLRVLDIDNCTFPDSDCAPSFPCLANLSLRQVGITEKLLQGMISNSAGIDAMKLDTNFGHRRLCLSMPSLRYLAVLVRCFDKREEAELENLVIEDASSLERLLLHQVNYGPSVRITGMTKLEMLGYLGTGFPIIQLGDSIFKGMVPVRLVEQFFRCDNIAFEMPEPKLKVVIDYLRCFPCLEKLSIKFNVNIWTSLETDLHWDPFAPNKCLDRSLKTIVLQSYDGLKTHVEFAKFFVKRAKVLRVMNFCCSRACTTRWIQNQHMRLNVERRASRHARFAFVSESDLPLKFWLDEAFSRDDPFIETL